MRNIRIKKKRLNQIINEENFRAYYSLRPLSSSQKLAIHSISKYINESTDMSPEEAGEMVGGAIGGGISAVGQFTANQIRDMNNSGMTQLLGDAFITTLRVDVMRFILRMIGLGGVAGEILSQALASIKISEWPEIIDTWETTGCETVADALTRGIMVKITQAGSQQAVGIASQIPIIGNDIRDLLGRGEDGEEHRLIRVIRQAGIESVDNIEEFDLLKSKVRDEICSFDIRNINAGSIDQLKTALIGLLPVAGVASAIPGSEDVLDNLKDAGERIAGNSPLENAEALGNAGVSVDDVDDNLGDTNNVAPRSAPSPGDYNADYFEQLAEIASEAGIFPQDSIDELERYARDLAGQ